MLSNLALDKFCLKKKPVNGRVHPLTVIAMKVVCCHLERGPKSSGLYNTLSDTSSYQSHVIESPCLVWAIASLIGPLEPLGFPAINQPFSYYSQATITS